MKIQQIRELVNIPDRESMVSFSGRIVSGRPDHTRCRTEAVCEGIGD